MVLKMDIALFVVLVFLQTSPSFAQFRGCSMEILRNQETLTRLVANAIADANDSSSLPSIMILNNHTVCLSVGPEVGTISSMSLLVEYERTNGEDNTTIVEQFDFGCTAEGSRYAWTASQFGRTGSRSPTAEFSTELRRDCSACIEKGVASDICIDDLYHVDPVSHCLACSSGCADTGMGLCFGMGTSMCCNYFLNGSCVDLCPSTTQPDSNYNCQRVVVGFNKTVYMVEERQALIVTLPVVVKEGQLTQMVVLQVTTEDRTTSAEDDYHVSNRRVRLDPGVYDNSGQVQVRIKNDDLSEQSEEFLVKLEIISGSASLDTSCTMVIILENEDEETPSDDSSVNVTMTTTSAPNTLIEDGCKAEVDEVWNLDWPSTARGKTAFVHCGQDKTGFATRKCLSGDEWAPANVSLCENALIAEIGKMAEELFSRPNVQPDEALVVVRELAEATMVSASSSNTSQLPRDLLTVSDIIANTVELLLQSTSADNGTAITKVNINETAVVVDVLNIILTNQNQDGFSSLHDDKPGTAGSSTVLNTAEKYSQYVGQTLVQDDTNKEPILFSRDNLVLLSERTNSDDIRPGTKDDDVIFPRMNELRAIVTAESVPASVEIPGALLQNQYDGNVSVTNLFFRDLHHLLPTVFDNGTVSRSFVISSQIHGTGMKQASSFPFKDTPITLTFRLELNDTDILPRCAFWDFSKGVAESGWSTDGLITDTVTSEGNSVTITCSSFHLTSFAVLVDVGGAKIDSKPLEVVSYIGISISLACLFLTIIFFASLGKKLLTAVHNFIHLNLSVSLFVAYFIFAVGIEVAASNEAGCKAVTALIQYFLLAAFCWMMCEGIMLYLMLVVVFSSWTRKWWLFLAIGWGPPLIFVAIGLSSVLDEYGVRGSDGELIYCWLASGSGKHAIWTFVAPMLAIIAVNSVFLVLVLRSIYISKSSQGSTKKSGRKEHSLAVYIVKASVILLPLLGLTWVIGVFAISENTAVFAWLFTIFNSLQGVSIFVLHVLRNDRVWGRFRKSLDDPGSFVRTLSRKTTGFSIVSRFSKHYGDSRDTDIELRMHTAAATTSSTHNSQDLEHVFEPREMVQIHANKESTDAPNVNFTNTNGVRGGSTPDSIADDHDLTTIDETTPRNKDFTDSSTGGPITEPTDDPIDGPTDGPTDGLTDNTAVTLTGSPTHDSTYGSTDSLTDRPTADPTDGATWDHTDVPMDDPINGQITEPSDSLTDDTTGIPIHDPTDGPTDDPTDGSTDGPTDNPTDSPTDSPTDGPTGDLTDGLTDDTIGIHTTGPIDDCTDGPTDSPTDGPTSGPTDGSTDGPMEDPIDGPTDGPTDCPTDGPSDSPTDDTTDGPTDGSTDGPTDGPSDIPTDDPTYRTTDGPAIDLLTTACRSSVSSSHIRNSVSSCSSEGTITGSCPNDELPEIKTTVSSVNENTDNRCDESI